MIMRNKRTWKFRRIKSRISKEYHTHYGVLQRRLKLQCGTPFLIAWIKGQSCSFPASYQHAAVELQSGQDIGSGYPASG